MSLLRLSIVGAFLVILAPVRAVILYGTDDPTANTTAPTAALAGSGWQYEGQFGSFLGTVIGANYFVTAKHIGGGVGQTFSFNGTAYTTTALFPDPSSDLQIWQVAGTFPVHAPLFQGVAGSEVNLNLVVFGRGTRRGDPFDVGGDSHLGGWLWGNADAVQRWGTNVVGSIYTDPSFGNLVRAPFDANAGPDEAHLSSGDSGGAVFVFDTTTNSWELAGINLAVDGPFSTSSAGTNPFNAAMFDTTGLFVQSDQGDWETAPNPSAFYATEIAAHKGFIESVMMQLMSVVSRKTHGNAGTFDVDLPESGSPGIECRFGGPTNDYTIVFTFENNVKVQGASITAGTGTVNSYNVAGNVVTVNITGVTTAQTIIVTLAGVSDGTNISDVQATMGVLVGDTNANGLVNSTDVSQTQSQSGQLVTSSNFREDVTVNGLINSSDVALVQSQSGTGLPPPPTRAKSNPTISTRLLITPLPPALDNTFGPTPKPRPKKLAVPSNTIRPRDQ
jgi:hypothetical protein